VSSRKAGLDRALSLIEPVHRSVELVGAHIAEAEIGSDGRIAELNLPLRPDTPQRGWRAGGFVTRSQGLGCPRGVLMAKPSELSTGAARRH